MPSLHLCMHVCGECWRVCNWSAVQGWTFTGSLLCLVTGNNTNTDNLHMYNTGERSEPEKKLYKKIKTTFRPPLLPKHPCKTPPLTNLRGGGGPDPRSPPPPSGSAHELPCFIQLLVFVILNAKTCIGDEWVDIGCLTSQSTIFQRQLATYSSLRICVFIF